MRYLVSDKAGKILRTVFVSNDAHAANQLLGDGNFLHLLPPEAGLIDNANLCVVNNVLAASEPKGATATVARVIQHEGMTIFLMASKESDSAEIEFVPWG